jgi:outer membrane protein TolC
VANIAGAYYNLLALDEQLRISQESLQNNIRIAETMKLLKESGKVNGAAIAQSEAARYAVELSIPELQQKIREAENAMNFLLGRTTSIIPRSTLPKQSDVPWISVGVPSQLLENRPDVVQAQYDVIQAYEMVNNAKSYFFPALNLTASAGFAASDLSLLLDPTAFAANFVAGLTAPIFNKRGNTTRLKVSKVQREQSLIHLRGTLLTAGQEVNNALFAYQTAQQKKDLRSKQVQSLETAVSMTRELLNYGTANYTEVLTAQEKLLAAQLGVVNDRAQQLAAQVSLYRALGGGWK